jgi:hypothetical protein
MAGKYAIDRFREGGGGAGIEAEFALERIGLKSPARGPRKVRAIRDVGPVSATSSHHVMATGPPFRRACKNRLPAFHYTGSKTEA